MIGILCPSIFERKALDAARLKRAGACMEVSGMGKIRSLLGCLRLYEKHPRLDGILLIGFAGGLTEDLAVGDVIEPDVFVEQDYCAEPFEKFPNRIKFAKRPLLVSGSRRAAMLTQDRFLTENPYKTGEAGFHFSTVACDMESYAVAKFCLEKNKRFAVVKLISDVADANADHDFLASCRRLAPKLNHTVLAAAAAFGKMKGRG